MLCIIVTTCRRRARRTGDDRVYRLVLRARDDEREATRPAQKSWVS